jgi:hypothetical protein
MEEKSCGANKFITLQPLASYHLIHRFRSRCCHSQRFSTKILLFTSQKAHEIFFTVFNAMTLDSR